MAWTTNGGSLGLYSDAARSCSRVTSTQMDLLVEAERRPFDGDLARADAEEAAELDDRGAYPAMPVDQHIDDAPAVTFAEGGDLLAENAFQCRRIRCRLQLAR